MANDVHDISSYNINTNPNDPLPMCNFPSIPKLSATVKSLLEISDSMDVAIVQSKISPSKTTNNVGPWFPDDKWSPRKQRTSKNYRKQVARLLLSKRNSTSVGFSRSSSMYADDRLETHTEIVSSRDAMDPYFKKRHSMTSVPSPKYTTSKSNTIAGNVPMYHQTPSLPTLITLQSPANRNFHSAFSLGKVEYNDPEMTSSDGVPLLLYTKTKIEDNISRQTKSSAALEKPESPGDNDQRSNSMKPTENCSKTSSSTRRPSNDEIETADIMKRFDGERVIKSDKELNRWDDENKNDNDQTHQSLPKIVIDTGAGINNNVPFPNNTNTRTNTITNSDRNGGSLYDRRFDLITSPPENPKILKILSQRKPSPPMCEFEDISLHIRHYRMYHTVRFTGRFSLANQQVPSQDEVKPVQWSEVFPHRPLSVNATTTVPVFRLNVQDFGNDDHTTNNNDDDNDNVKALHSDKPVLLSATSTSSAISISISEDRSKLEVPSSTRDDEKDSEVAVSLGEEYKSYRRRSTPNYKDRSVTIDLTPTVTPVKVKRVRDEGDDIEDNFIQEDKDTKAVPGDKHQTVILEKECSDTDSPQKRTKIFGSKKKFGQRMSSKNGKKSTKRLANLSGDVNIVGNLNMKSEEGETANDSSGNESNQQSFSSDHQGASTSSNNVEGERTTSKVLFSYREFLKRSASNVSKDGLYVPRLRQTRESTMHETDRQNKSREGDWRYPYSRKHAFISILHSDKDSSIQNWRNIIIDEKRLKASIEEKIKDSKLQLKSRRRDPDEVGDKFTKFMVNQEGEGKRWDSKPSDQNKFRELREFKKTSSAFQEENDVTTGLGIVSAYDVNTYDSDTDDVIHVEENESPRNPKTSVDSTPTKQFWCPKNSCLSARSRKTKENTDTMRQLISTPFHSQALQLPQVNNSAFVSALPPPRKGFDDRSVVLPLQDFVHLAMKGCDQTFSNVSKSINDRKLGISQNMTIRSSSSRRSVDDGLVRLVSFASPVNQFIFAKRITGHSAATRGVPISDGTSLDTEQKARSVFHGKGSGSFRLRLKDFGLRRPKAENPQGIINELPNHDEEIEIADEENKIDVQEHGDNDDGACNDDDGSKKGVDEIAGSKEKKYLDIYIPNDEEDNTEPTSKVPITGDDDARGRQDATSTTSGLIYPKGAQMDNPLSEKEREMSALRKRIVKLAEMRTSSQASMNESPHTSGIYEGHASLSTSCDMAKKTDTHGFKLVHGANKVTITTGLANDFNDKDTYVYDNEINNPNKHTNELTSIENQEKLLSQSHQHTRFNMRQKAKSRKRLKIFKPNAIIHKDIKVETTSSSMESTKQFAHVTKSKGPPQSTAETKGPLVPEGNPMMYSRIVRGSCLKKDIVSDDDDEVQRPKTVRFKCDGVEFKIVERINDKK